MLLKLTKAMFINRYFFVLTTLAIHTIANAKVWPVATQQEYQQAIKSVVAGDTIEIGRAHV